MHTDEEGNVDWNAGRIEHGLARMRTDEE